MVFGFFKKKKLPRWAKGHGYQHEVVGESHYQETLERIAGGRQVYGARKRCVATLVPEPSNKYDANAVRVDVKGKVVGYLPREKAAEYSKRIAEIGLGGQPIEAHANIVGGWDDFERETIGDFGIKISISKSWQLED